MLFTKLKDLVKLINYVGLINELFVLIKTSFKELQPFAHQLLKVTQKYHIGGINVKTLNEQINTNETYYILPISL